MNYYPKYPAPPVTLQKPYSVTILGKPYLSQLSKVSPLAAASDYASARSRDYHNSFGDDLMPAFGPSHDLNLDPIFETRSHLHRPVYIPDYEPVLRTGSYGYTPRWYNTSTTVTRTGPYGITRTYRY